MEIIDITAAQKDERSTTVDYYIIRIEKDSTGKGIYQLRLYINGIGNEPFTGNITSFDKVFHYAMETKRCMEVKLHTQLPLSIIGISKDVLDTYGDIDEELKAFLERKELDTVPEVKKGRTTFLDAVKKHLS